MTHFPPTDIHARRTAATSLISGCAATACVFGHVHNLRGFQEPWHVDGIPYYLTACDFLNFRLLEL